MQQSQSTTLHVDLLLPAPVSADLKRQLVQESREQAVLALFKRGTCSAGLAAQLLNLSFHDFLEFLKAHGLTYAPGTPEATEADRHTLTWMKSKHWRVTGRRGKKRFNNSK